MWMVARTGEERAGECGQVRRPERRRLRGERRRRFHIPTVRLDTQNGKEEPTRSSPTLSSPVNGAHPRTGESRFSQLKFAVGFESLS